MNFDPQLIQKHYRTGTGDMGDVTDAETVAQVTYTDPQTGEYAPFVLASFLAWFVGGTLSATIELKQRLNKATMNTEHYDNVVRRFLDAGAGVEDFISFRVDPREAHHWSYAAGDILVPEWTNPDPGVTRWNFEMRLHPVV
jgi:hypothetical protein